MEDGAKIKEHFNRIAGEYDHWKRKNWYYYAKIKEFYKKRIPEGRRVLELGCGTAEILNAVSAGYGVGVDISDEMIKIAKNKFPGLNFVRAGAEELAGLDEKFEYVILSDLIDHARDIWKVFLNLDNLTQKGSTVVITTINPLWDPLFAVFEKLKLKMPEGPHNFLFKADIINLMKLFGYKVREDGFFLLFPLYIPFISDFINRYGPRIPLIRNLCLVQYIVARKIRGAMPDKGLSCSVVVPCYNEAQNLEECLRRIPQMGKFTEVIIVDDGSTDNTALLAREIIRQQSHMKLITYPQNRGKAYALRQAFNAASGDILIILDADMSVIPEDLEKFFWALNRSDDIVFVNGTRMVYPMQKEAMRALNLLGNKIFSLIFSWLLGQRITDTLCGTKAVLRRAYHDTDFTRHDPWGDFDLLINIAGKGYRMAEMPVRYKRRLKGQSKMRVLRHGFKLLLRCFIGFRELKLSKALSKKDVKR